MPICADKSLTKAHAKAKVKEAVRRTIELHGKRMEGEDGICSKQARITTNGADETVHQKLADFGAFRTQLVLPAPVLH